MEIKKGGVFKYKTPDQCEAPCWGYRQWYGVIQSATDLID